ncbi:hypothetical protein E4U57_007039 [Claviceps arundinis]|uniref:Uncharacterized protein n=1 Tax=Claviceps arundinis TaxID=1623583 RepID=A0ABQ7P3B0_9HYPO|nr:hypothetical protein E4U57_007039 [Claviceps arundinis]
MERYETDDDDNLSDESASLYTSDELYLDDASDNEKEISSEGEVSFLPRTRRRIIPASEFLTCTAAPDFSASQALGMFQETCCMDYGRWQYGSTSSTGDDFPQFHLDMGSLVGLPLRSVILEGSSSANGDNGLDLALCESITRLEKWMTKYGIEGD